MSLPESYKYIEQIWSDTGKKVNFHLRSRSHLVPLGNDGYKRNQEALSRMPTPPDFLKSLPIVWKNTTMAREQKCRD